HAKDMEVQRKYGVEYSKYWVNEKAGKIFCLVHAPNAEAAEHVHREAHGMLAEKIIEVQPELAEAFFGGVETNDAGAVLVPGSPLKVIVGAAAGEHVEQNNDLFGSTVQLAARLCGHAQPEQILVSNAIPDLCIGKGLLFEDVGEVVLKGFGYPVRAHAAVWADQATRTAV